MPNQINQLQNEIFEKKNFLKQAETSIKDFIRDKVGNVLLNINIRKCNLQNMSYIDYILRKKE